MRKFFYTVTAMLLAVFTTSCLDSNLEDLPEFEDAEITGLNNVYYRYISDEKHEGSQDYKVKQMRIPNGVWTVTNDTEDEASATFVIQFNANFEQFKGKLSLEELVVVFNISQGAIIRPIEGSAVLGTPGDWSGENKYEVTAANGKKKIWTVKIGEIRNGSYVGL